MEWRKPGQVGRRNAWIWGALAAALALSILLEPHLPSVHPNCLLYESAGIPCPTCGSTRAVNALLRGDVSGALNANPLAAVGLPLFILGGALAALWIGLLGRAVPHPESWRTWGGFLLLAILIQWVYLVVRGS